MRVLAARDVSHVLHPGSLDVPDCANGLEFVVLLVEFAGMLHRVFVARVYLPLLRAPLHADAAPHNSGFFVSVVAHLVVVCIEFRTKR